MGLFDTVRCSYPLPHHQDAVYQTKDIEALIEGCIGLGGTMSDYEITEDGRLRVEVHEREWVEEDDRLLGGYFKSVRDWWEDVPDPHGDIRIYTGGRGEPWVEFRIRFTNGVVQEVEEVQEAPAS